jgi:hypothetical protein
MKTIATVNTAAAQPVTSVSTWGRGDGDFDSGFSMNFSSRDYGYSYGHPYYSCGYAPYGYAPVTAPVALQAGITAR